MGTWITDTAVRDGPRFGGARIDDGSPRERSLGGIQRLAGDVRRIVELPRGVLFSCASWNADAHDVGVHGVEILLVVLHHDRDRSRRRGRGLVGGREHRVGDRVRRGGERGGRVLSAGSGCHGDFSGRRRSESTSEASSMSSSVSESSSMSVSSGGVDRLDRHRCCRGDRCCSGDRRDRGDGHDGGDRCCRDDRCDGGDCCCRGHRRVGRP